jgi:hypothetical protein
MKKRTLKDRIKELPSLEEIVEASGGREVTG